MNCGVPQDTIMGQVDFSIYINDILHREEVCLTQQNLFVLKHSVTETLSRLSAYFSESKLLLNKSKAYLNMTNTFC